MHSLFNHYSAIRQSSPLLFVSALRVTFSQTAQHQCSSEAVDLASGLLTEHSAQQSVDGSSFLRHGDVPSKEPTAPKGKAGSVMKTRHRHRGHTTRRSVRRLLALNCARPVGNSGRHDSANTGRNTECRTANTTSNRFKLSSPKN